MDLELIHGETITEGKLALHVAALLALGLGIPTIAHMLRVPEEKVQSVAQESEESQEQLRLVDYANFIEHWEGNVSQIYRDSVGVSTIGVGFNLQRGDADQRLRQVGSSLAHVQNGTTLTVEQIRILRDADVSDAFQRTIMVFPEFDEYPNDVKLVLVDMMFNLGPSRFGGFRRMIAAVHSRDWNAMANEMENSQWFNQVGRRSRAHVNRIRALPALR